ncbi:MAG: hypothetical protein GX653_05735 [Clostridiales bacterium]|nr:hypothetical protein [Clostridiales bacterium]
MKSKRLTTFTIQANNLRLYEKIRAWIKDFVDKIREAFSQLDTQRSEAKALMEPDANGMLRYPDELVKRWDLMAMDSMAPAQKVAPRNAPAVPVEDAAAATQTGIEQPESV